MQQSHSHVLIELKGIHFLHHALTCEDCKAFVTDFGKNSFDWFIDINGLIKRLDLRFFGSEYTDNKATHIISYYFQGTKLKLNLDNSTIDEINNELLVLIEKEEFEQCCFLRDKLKALQDNIGS